MAKVKDKKSPRYKQLEKLLKQPLRGSITVGLHAQEGGDQHETSGFTVAEIASAHEFGAGVPQRSWLRAWFDENKSKFPEAIRLELEAALRNGNLENVLDVLAVTFQGSIQERIAEGILPENHPATIAKKGSSTPLIDTGQLRSSILAKVDR